MKSSLLLLPFSALTLAAPLAKRQNIDPIVLQFALTLEHLENVFYKEALGNFSLSAFQKAGYSSTVYKNVQYIAHDEEQHVLFLEKAITAAGYTPNQACSYNFKFTDVKSFLTLSSILEGVGTSAYLGGAGLITSKAYLTAAGSILVTEAKHTAQQRGVVGRVPAANPYGTPIDPTSIYTLASAFITSCPAGNTALPFTPFPALNAGSPQPIAPGREFYFTYNGTIPSGSYATFVNGLDVISKTISHRATSKFSSVVPSMFGGQTFVFVTSSNYTGAAFNTSGVLFGPALIEVSPLAPTYNNAIL